MSERKLLLILDANVLIDIFQCDRRIVTLVTEYVGQVMVATTILAEVHDVTEDDCRELGMIPVEPTLEQVLSAKEKLRPLSFQDWVCFLLAVENNWICVTNDKLLRTQCAQHGLTVMWELEMLCLLVEAGGLTQTKCKTIVLKIRDRNPLYITDEIVRSVFTRLGIQY